MIDEMLFQLGFYFISYRDVITPRDIDVDCFLVSFCCQNAEAFVSEKWNTIDLTRSILVFVIFDTLITPVGVRLTIPLLLEETAMKDSRSS